MEASTFAHDVDIVDYWAPEIPVQNEVAVHTVHRELFWYCELCGQQALRDHRAAEDTACAEGLPLWAGVCEDVGAELREGSDVDGVFDR